MDKLPTNAGEECGALWILSPVNSLDTWHMSRGTYLSAVASHSTSMCDRSCYLYQILCVPYEGRNLASTTLSHGGLRCSSTMSPLHLRVRLPRSSLPEPLSSRDSALEQGWPGRRVWFPREPRLVGYHAGGLGGCRARDQGEPRRSTGGCREARWSGAAVRRVDSWWGMIWIVFTLDPICNLLRFR